MDMNNVVHIKNGVLAALAMVGGTLKGTITGPRVSKIIEVAHDIQSGYLM